MFSFRLTLHFLVTITELVRIQFQHYTWKVNGHHKIFPYLYNFTHRIDKFSFGKSHAGIVSPLEGDEKIAEKSRYP